MDPMPCDLSGPTVEAFRRTIGARDAALHLMEMLRLRRVSDDADAARHREHTAHMPGGSLLISLGAKMPAGRRGHQDEPFNVVHTSKGLSLYSGRRMLVPATIPEIVSNAARSMEVGQLVDLAGSDFEPFAQERILDIEVFPKSFILVMGNETVRMAPEDLF